MRRASTERGKVQNVGVDQDQPCREINRPLIIQAVIAVPDPGATSRFARSQGQIVPTSGGPGSD